MKLRAIAAAGVIILLTGSVHAADKFTKEFEVGSAPELIVDAEVAEVEITEGSAGMITALVELPDKDRYRLSSSQEGDVVNITLKNKGLKGWLFSPFDLIGDDGPRISLKVPSQSKLTVFTDAGPVKVKDLESTMIVRTDAGGIRLDGVSGDADLNTGSGTIRVEEFSGILDAGTDAGSVNVSNCEGEFSVSTGVGGIDFDDVEGTFRVRSEVGTIDFAGSITGGQDNSFRNGVGSIDLTLYDVADLFIDAKSNLGSVSISPRPKSTEWGEHFLTTTIGEGTAKVRLRTDLGSISVAKGEKWEEVHEDQDDRE